MRNACRHTLVLFVIPALLLAPSLANAYDLTYSGETPVGSGEGNEGIAGLSGGSPDYWDYVYDLTHDAGGPDTWGIQVDYAPVQDSIHQPDNWSQGVWYSSIDHDQLPDLSGMPGIVWEWTNFGDAGPFSFQSAFEPAYRSWQAEDTPVGTEWSASPEPASLLLSSLALLGVGFWRRRKTT